MKDRAWAQLGTSGSGNHFVEFGLLTVLDDAAGLSAGEIPRAAQPLAAAAAPARRSRDHYSWLARSSPGTAEAALAPGMAGPRSEAGQEYWAAMELMGRYAAANHALIHAHMARALGVEVLLDMENHHNFAWRERHRLGRHGSRGHRAPQGRHAGRRRRARHHPRLDGHAGLRRPRQGVAASLNSASHGAGRRMSRTKAREMFTWDAAQRFLRERGVTLLSAGLDEVPMAYKDIDEVMAAQRDLVEPLARFEPRLVKMAPSGEPPED